MRCRLLAPLMCQPMIHMISTHPVILNLFYLFNLYECWLLKKKQKQNKKLRKKNNNKKLLILSFIKIIKQNVGKWRCNIKKIIFFLKSFLLFWKKKKEDSSVCYMQEIVFWHWLKDISKCKEDLLREECWNFLWPKLPNI